MQCENLSDDQLWRAIAQNTAKLSALIHQQIELDVADSSAIHPRARGDLIRFAGRIQREYRQYAEELRRRHPLG
jgi:conjugal transfer/entry exclusion protein